MESINTLLCGIIMPFFLMATGIWLCAKMKLFFILHPVKLVRDLKEASAMGGITPFRALSQALAGTLGVGNMTGVAAAIACGGAGAVFWMWLSALLAMSIKYFEVGLAVKCRKKGPDGFFGGAMYYIRDIFSSKLSGHLSRLFALLCIANSLLTGNILQMNAAANAIPAIPPMITGIILCSLALPVILGGAKKVSALTLRLIPFLALLYISLSLIIIIPAYERLPEVFSRIMREAFSLKSAGGGIGGFMIARAIRFGTTRGILSNEAGSGTSPTAHASANTKSPHHQGCFGIFEVFADTILLCTLTAIVILLAPAPFEDLSGIGLTLFAFFHGAGSFAALAVAISTVLFAYATIICQSAYAFVAIESLSDKSFPKALYVLIFCICTVFGTLIGEGAMWQWADLVVALMTVINLFCLISAAKKGYLRAITEGKHLK